MQLTKTNFIHYLNCPKSLWVFKHDPASYPDSGFSTFIQKLVQEGYEVEKYVRDLFVNKKNVSVNFQKIFKTEDGLFARADVFEETDDGRSILYEVKSSTSVKTDKDHSHIKDACFQRVTAERMGQNIDQVFIVHLDGNYIRGDEVDPEKLIHIEDVTKRVDEIYDETILEMDEALTLLKQDAIDRKGCSCLFKSRGHHCDTFSYFNDEIPMSSIYSLPRLGENKRHELIANNMFDLRDVPLNFPLSETQALVLKASHELAPQIDLSAIKNFLNTCQFPLHFFDYETFSSAVPMVKGSSPHKHIPVQYSLHILEEDGTLHHKEFLQRKQELPIELVEQMEQDFCCEGSVISWHASFEKTQNKEMAKWFPAKAAFLNDLNIRMLDLEDVFKKPYVDSKFEGSTSIKKVLPVLCPHLGYDSLDVQDGASAMDAWQKMIDPCNDEPEIIALSLLQYCKLDTFAMLEIYNFLKRL